MKTIYQYPKYSFYIYLVAFINFIILFLTNEIDRLGMFFLVLGLLVTGVGLFVAFKTFKDGIFLEGNDLMLVVRGKKTSIQVAEIARVTFKYQRLFTPFDFGRTGGMMIPEITIKDGTVMSFAFNLKTTEQEALRLYLRK